MGLIDDTNCLMRELTESNYFRRLHNISFLGIIDYLNSNHVDKYLSRFSRADHTYGVCELASILIGSAEFSKEDCFTIIAAAVCHDMGHSAFSHSLERAYRNVNPLISHRSVVQFILEDRDSDISKILLSHNLSIDRIIKLCIGNNNDHLNWIFHDPLNIDTIDGIYRFYLSFRLRPPFSRYGCVDAIVKLYNDIELSYAEVDELDRFWDSKASFYEHFLSRGAYADYENNFVEHASRSLQKIDLDDYFKTESDIVKALDWDSIASTDRNSRPRKMFESQFMIKKEIKLTSLNDLRLRYVRSKSFD